MLLGIKPTVDFAFKKVFGSPENSVALIGLLNAILNLPRPIVSVRILNPFSYQEFAQAKLVVLDIADDLPAESRAFSRQRPSTPSLSDAGPGEWSAVAERDRSAHD